jgi:hypothetical protein
VLARYGDELTFDLLDHKGADLRAKRAPDEPPPADELADLASFRTLVESQLSSPHRLRDLAVGGDDLLALGYPAGPELGHALRALLTEVVEDPSLNTREALLARAEELLRS